MGILRRVEKFMSLIRRDLELSVRKDWENGPLNVAAVFVVFAVSERTVRGTNGWRRKL